MEAVKKCSKCGQYKTLIHFSLQTGSKDGHYAWCKECCKELYRKKKNAVAEVKVTPKHDIKLVLHNAARTFGEEATLKKIAEECSEYCKAWFDYESGRKDAYVHLIEELADLFVTAWKGRIVVGARTLDQVIDMKIDKLVREMEAVEDDLK